MITIPYTLYLASNGSVLHRLHEVMIIHVDGAWKYKKKNAFD